MLMPMLWKRDNDVKTYNDPFMEMDDMMNHFFGGNFSLSEADAMKTDVIENENGYTLEAELPGFQKEDIHVDLEKDTLKISASHEEKNEDKKEGKYIRRERTSRSFTRSFHVEGFKPEDIKASYKNGVLSVSIPKKEALPEKEESTRIEVGE